MLAIPASGSCHSTDTEFSHEDWCRWSSDSNTADQSPGSEDQDNDGESSPSNRSNRPSLNTYLLITGNSNTTARKRGLTPGGGDDDGDTQKRRKRVISQADSVEPCRFACHFWKRDPSYYHDGTSKKFQSCPCPNFKEFRAIK